DTSRVCRSRPPESLPSRSFLCFFFSSRRRHTRSKRDWSSDVCSSDLQGLADWISAHVGAFAAIGGIPALLVPDNTKVAVIKASQIGRASCREGEGRGGRRGRV